MDLKEKYEVLSFANYLAYEAGLISLKYYQSNTLQKEFKKDGSVVTEADKRCEEFIRTELAKHFPNHGVLGEEFGEDNKNSEYRWIIDPIDGTFSFARGVPLYGTMIGIEVNKRAEIGSVFLPALNEIIYGIRGQDAFWHPKVISSKNFGEKIKTQVSQIKTLSESTFCTNDHHGFIKANIPNLYLKLHHSVKSYRGWSDCYAHVLLATGRIDFVIEPLMHIWDCAALLPIIEASGGTFTDLKGNITHDGGNAIASNSYLHKDLLKIIKDELKF